jgi:hypothetical protein
MNFLDMLDTNDIKILREMFEENNQVLKREIRDEMHSVVNAAVSASEKRMMHRMDAIVEEIQTTRNDILEVINDGILPQIDAHDRDVARLKVAVNIV